MKKMLWAIVFLAPSAFAQLRPVNTFSIVARDPQTGQIGVAVQSHWFSVGSVVPWAEAGVGAIARSAGMSPGAVPVQIDLERAFEQLSETSRAVVWLHDVEGYTHEEIAEQMGKTVSFSKSQLARAHARLRGMLDDEGVAP